MNRSNNIYVKIQNRQKQIPIGRSERDLLRRTAVAAYRMGAVNAGVSGYHNGYAAYDANPVTSGSGERSGGSGAMRLSSEIGVGTARKKTRKPAGVRRYNRICAKVTGNGRETAGVTYILTDDAGIRELNLTNRGIDKATDVLSFPANDAYYNYAAPASGYSAGCGDVVISAERAFKQADEFGHGFDRELGFLGVHGALHLMGYDHDRGSGADSGMFELTEKILAFCGLTRVAADGVVREAPGDFAGESPETFRSGFVAVAGRPNVGKSTLINAVCGNSFSIVTDKPQTTRRNARMILTTDSYQLVFIDTPGLHIPRNRLGELMRKKALSSVRDADAVLLMTDARDGRFNAAGARDILDIARESDKPVILLINKVDLVKKEKLLPYIAMASGEYDFAHIIPISATDPETRGVVIDTLLGLMPAGGLLYPEDMITDQTDRRLVEDIIREKALLLLDQEIPHGVDVEVDRFANREKDGLLEINATIYCEREAHKKIIIGKNGDVLKRIGVLARPDIEKLRDERVFLGLWVKVRKDWRNNEAALRRMGYTDGV